VRAFTVEIEREKHEAEERRKFLEDFADYQKKVNELLKRREYSELLEYYQTEKMSMVSKLENKAAIMWIILNIYQMEIDEGIEEGILSKFSDMQSAVEHYLKMKFLMWRFEFMDEGAGLSEMIDSHPSSVPFFKYLIHTSSFDKANTAFKLALLLKKKGKWGKAFAILNYVNELTPDEEIVFCEMADICIQTGQTGSAAECLGRIKEPSEILVEYQKKWGI
jgi:hypothetical protein